MTLFSLLHVLFWIALTLAPRGTTQIEISSGNETWLWKQAPTGWVESADNSIWTVSGDKVTKVAKSNVDIQDVRHFVDGVQGHDWTKEPLLKLGPMKSLEATKDGFIYTINRGDPTAKTYRIVFIGLGAHA